MQLDPDRVRFFPGHPDGLFWVHDLFWLLIIVAVVIGLILIVREVIRPGGSRPWHGQWTQSAALTALDMRYARGEIDRAEYLQRRADLLGQPSPDPDRSGPAPPAGAAKK